MKQLESSSKMKCITCGFAINELGFVQHVACITRQSRLEQVGQRGTGPARLSWRSAKSKIAVLRIR